MIRGKQTVEGKKIVKAGYPYCYQIKGWLKHCPVCIKNYKLEKKREKQIKK